MDLYSFWRMIWTTCNFTKSSTRCKRTTWSRFQSIYRLFSPDSSEISQTYRPFPGYKNLIDVDGDGFGDDIIDLSKNDGRPDAFVSPNEFFKFSEYQFSVDNLEQFTGFVIKVVMISTNESYPVFIKDFRAIALAWYQYKVIKIFFVMKKQVP